ncbi:MAG: GNAT family N-acetyltransferase [Halolamina sp.]
MTAATVRVADADDRVAVARLVDGALLDLAHEDLQAGLDREDVLVAERDDRVVGAVVLDGDHIAAVAVHRRHRRSGVGTALLRAAVAREGRLTAAFDADVRSFYESLGFETERRDGRLFGSWTPERR